MPIKGGWEQGSVTTVCPLLTAAGGHRAPRAPICCSLQSTRSYLRCWNRAGMWQTCPHCSSTDQTHPLAPLHPVPLSTCCAENIDLWLHRPFLLPLFFLPGWPGLWSASPLKELSMASKEADQSFFFHSFARKPEGLSHPCRGTWSSRQGRGWAFSPR